MEITQVPFLSVVKDITSKFSKIPNKNFINEGSFAVVDQSATLIAGYTNDVSKVTGLGYPVIVFGDHTRIIKYINFPFAIGADGVKVLSVDTELAFPEYVYYFLKFLNIPSAGYSRHYKFLKVKKIALPKSIDDQKRIAKVLSNLEVLIQKRNESNDLLDELLKSTFLEMFGDPGNNPHKLPIKKLSSTFLEKPSLGTTIPAITMGLISLVRVGEIGEREINLDKCKFSNIPKGKIEKYLLKDGDILLARAIGSESHLGKASIFFDSGKAVVYDSHVMRLRFDQSKVNPDFFYIFLKTSGGRKRFMAKAGKTAIQFNINSKQISDIQIPLPLISTQNKFAYIVKEVEVIKAKFNESLLELENLYGSISQQAFKGELDLNKVDISDIDKSEEEVNVLKKKLIYKEIISVKEEKEIEKYRVEIQKQLEGLKIEESYLTDNIISYCARSKAINKLVKDLVKSDTLDLNLIKKRLSEINEIGEKLRGELKDLTPFQIDRHKYYERYIAYLPDDILTHFPSIGVFSEYDYDYGLMTLSDYLGVPKNIQYRYGTEESNNDWEFFIKQQFSKKLFLIDDIEGTYNQMGSYFGLEFDYEKMKEFIFSSMEGEEAFLRQVFDKVDKRIKLQVY